MRVHSFSLLSQRLAACLLNHKIILLSTNIDAMTEKIKTLDLENKIGIKGTCYFQSRFLSFSRQKNKRKIEKKHIKIYHLQFVVSFDLENIA